MDWIDQLEAEDSQKKDRANADTQEAIAAGLLLAEEMPEFVRQLGVELQAQVAKLPKIGVVGSFADHSQQGFETRYNINLRRESLNPRLAAVNVFHLTGSHAIRCHPLERKAFELRFTVHPKGGIAVYSEANLTLMNPYQAAQFILRPEVETVRPRH